MYTGLELQSYGSKSEADEACAQLERLDCEYRMQQRLSGDARWVLVDARHRPSAFLRFVNSPEGMEFSENAHLYSIWQPALPMITSLPLG